PKLTVTQIGDLKLKEATDDAGNSLLPKPQAAAAAAAATLIRGVRTVNHMVESRLSYPDQPGKKIALIRGELSALLAQDVQRYEVDDVLGTAPKTTNPLNK